MALVEVGLGNADGLLEIVFGQGRIENFVAVVPYPPVRLNYPELAGTVSGERERLTSKANTCT